ncbi:alanine aminotransferase 1-like [Anticarsia gemmatalis]|uniref:alanine aminotransferase 1-like n=1 Tax=Anticarsia gemmatalis TaxID=129554 RepID=UPI003F774D4E
MRTLINASKLIRNQKYQSRYLATETKMVTPYKKALTIENLNPNIVKLEYAVRGPLFLRVTEIEKELANGVKKPFKKVIKANVGDAQAMGQSPITFIRQVIACISYPEVLNSGNFPNDVKERSLEILQACGGKSIGSYSSAIGIELIRKSVASYIEKRDGFPANWEDICLVPGASAGIKGCLQLFVNDLQEKSGVMVPIPQYPLYSASLAEYGLTQVDYYLNESKNWALTYEDLEKSYQNGSKNCQIRALVVINPGNPTGQVLSKENIEMIIKFAYEKSLFIFADEVYQHNIYEGEFHSFKKVLNELGSPYNQVELASFMSMSKGYMGECGLRGGWMELVNMDPKVKANLYKSIFARLCPTTLGQAVVDCVARPPQKGEDSYDLYERERNSVLLSLKERAKMIEEMFNKLDGFSCNIVQGAMYAFPRIELPVKAIEAAKKAGQEPDVFYAFKLLEATGICVIPGSGFGQAEGTYHFRTTILPETELMKEMLDIFHKFHVQFTRDYY